MLEKRKTSTSFPFECALIFLAMLVISWGLQAKLAQYHVDQGAFCTTNSMAKLLVENRSALTTVPIQDQGLPRLLPETDSFVVFPFSLQRHQVSSAKLAELEPGPRVPGQYFLHGPDLKRRPPPVFS
jgi:hypothetical protein